MMRVRRLEEWRKSINLIKTLDGTWIDKLEEIKQLFKDWYQHLYTSEVAVEERHITNNKFLGLTHNEWKDMGEELSREEIIKALSTMSPWKSPGPVGFPAVFYQKSWSKVGNKVCGFVQNLWKMASKIVEVNRTNICRIPKVSSHRLVSQFWPITLL